MEDNPNSTTMRAAAQALLVLLVFVLACGTAKRGEPHFAPVPVSEPAIAAGEVVYHAYCQKCHPGGEAGLGPAINNKPAPGMAMRLQIRQGLGSMPAFKKNTISEEEMDHLIAYLKVLRKAKKPATTSN
ncbi:c-type cytochrome [Pontibacter sp. 13R65]|uniref:c-type cytochrome n=1 Tax=Pontibacter sp. 13R65 TaxID=3127458 RepID=UPI00301E3F9E